MQLTKVYFTNFMHICRDAVKKTAMRIEESFPLCASLCSVSLCETFFHVSQMVLYGVNTG